jgi:hypothetical protein
MVMPGGSTEERLEELLKGCLSELVNELGATPVPETGVAGEPSQPAGSDPGQIAAIIGFGNHDMQGALILVGERRLFARLFPRFPGLPMESRDIVDWSREFANLAVGRFKNRACARGVEMDLECPQSLSLEQADLLPARGRPLTPWSIDLEGMRLQTRFTFEIFGPVFLEQSDAVQDRDAAAEGGQVLLF